MRSDTAATTDAHPPKLPDSLSAGFAGDVAADHGEFDVHMFDSVAFDTRPPYSRQTPSPGSNVPQGNSVIPTRANNVASTPSPVIQRHDNSSSSSLKPPELEKTRRSSFFSNIKNKISKNSSNTQLSFVQPTPAPAATAEEPFASGSLLASSAVNEDRPAIGSVGQSLNTNRRSAPAPLVDTPASGNPMATMTQNRRTWGEGSNEINNGNRNEPHNLQQKAVRIEADSDDEDDAPLFPPTVKSPLVAVTTTSRSPSPRSPAAMGMKTHDNAGNAEASGKSPISGEDDLIAAASIAAQFEEVSLKEDPPKKVMTEAQYARLRQETAEADDDDDADSYVEDIEDEDDRKQKHEAHQARLKQQAMLSIQRQRMLKVTDGSAPATSHRGSIAELHTSLIGASASSPNLVPGKGSVSPHSSVTDGQSSHHKSDSGHKSNDDEDENVPLGILASHGFPNKRRPPSKLLSSASNPNLSTPGSAKSEYFPQPGVQAGLPPALPVFARNLPQDPYYGAGLVNHNPRESLAMGGGQQPTGGLVGVIANEERARASRRKSPNNAGPMFTGGQPGGMMRHSVVGMPMPPQGMVPPLPR
ncbi:hypothetical protein KEM56_003385 [Ascosphaera pollenicola]|nr:hypothetical protein KEM56_003385 [Ascosphaera pollenicola]